MSEDVEAQPVGEPAKPLDVSALARSIRLAPGTLPSATVQDLINAKTAQIQGLEQQAQSLHERIETALASHEGQQASELKEDLDDCSRRWQECQHELSDLQDGYQEALLNERQVASLGSKRRLQLKEMTILVLILIVLSVLVVDMTHTLAADVAWRLFWFDTAICVVFMANFFFELVRAENKRWYWRTHWIDFITSIPIPPVVGDASVIRGGRSLRLLRMLRMMRALRALRALRVILFLWRGMEQLSRVMDVRLMKRSLVIMLGVIALGAVTIQFSEGAVEPVNSTWDRIWWSFTTTVTGGFGDIHNPESTSGRVLTVLLIIAGMVIVGVFTATLTSVLVREDEAVAELEAELQQLRTEQDRFQAEVRDDLQAIRTATGVPRDLSGND